MTKRGRIRGWRKMMDMPKMIVWRSIHTGRELDINKRDVGQGWKVSYGLSLGSRKFPTKKEAYEFAVTWMRSHPTGI